MATYSLKVKLYVQLSAIYCSKNICYDKCEFYLSWWIDSGACITSNAATDCEQEHKKDKRDGEGTCGGAEKSEVTNKLQLDLNGMADKVVVHLTKIEDSCVKRIRHFPIANGDGSTTGGIDGRVESKKSEVTKKLLGGSNVETDKVVDHLDSCSKRSSTLSRMAYHEHTLESMRSDSPLSASMSLLSTDTNNLHNNDDDIDSPRQMHHETQIDMVQINPDLGEAEDYCFDSSQIEMTPDNLSICSSGSISTIGSMNNEMAETEFSIIPPQGTIPKSRDKKSQLQDNHKNQQLQQEEEREMELLADNHKMHQKTPGGIPRDVGLQYRKGNEEESSFTDYSSRNSGVVL